MTSTSPRPTRANAVLALLFTGAFVMGCAEMLVVGMLDLIAADLEVSVPAAGALVTANALGLAIGGPLLTLLVTRFDRRPVILVAVALFVLGNLVPAIAGDYATFLALRALLGALQGLFIAAGMVVATSIVPPERAGRAMALVIGGFATASAIGLPIGTLLGQAVGWRGSFAAVVAAGAIAFVASLVLVPSVPAGADARATGQARFAFAPRVLAVLGVALLLFAAMLSAITYLVPYLGTLAGVAGPAIGVFLLAYGVSTTLGSIGGGRFADVDARRSLVVGAAGVAGSLAVLWLFGSNPWVAGAAVIGIGLSGMGAAPSLQHRVVALAGPGAPLAASLPASAVNAGIAIGSLAGGAAIEAAGVRAAPVAGIAFAVLAIAAAAASARLRPARTAPAPALHVNAE